MMLLIIAFIILLASVYLGLQLQYDPGYVLIAINKWTIETNFWVGIFALFLLFVITYLSIRLLGKLVRTPSAFNTWRSKYLAHKAQATTRKGLIEYSEGYWLKAKNHLIQALPNTDTPLLNYLTAARAAQKMGDSTLRDHYLREAQQSMPEAQIAVELTQAQLQLDDHQWEQALATLRHLQDLAPRHPYVLKLLMHLYEEVKDWNQLIALLPILKKNKVVSNEEFLALQQRTYNHAIEDLIKQHQGEAVNNLFHSLPKPLNNDPEIVSAYASFLLNNSDYVNAELILRRGLQHNFSDALVNLYGQLPATDKLLTFAESLLKKYPHSAALQLCIARLCLGLHLWGKAKNHLEQAIQIMPTAIAYLTLGKLHEQLDEPVNACANYKKGLELEAK